MPTTTTSLSTSACSIVKSLLDAETKWLGKDRIWMAPNSDQTRFLEALNRCYSDSTALEQVENTIATNQPKEIAEWAKANNISNPPMEIDPKSELWVGSALNITPSWEKPGRANQRYVERTLYNFVTMREGFRFHAPPANMIDPVSPQSNAPVNFCVRIGCPKGASLWLMMVEDVPSNPLDIAALVHNIQKNRCETPEPCAKPRLHFPMVRLEHEMNLDWLSGLNTEDEEGQTWTIAGGVQKHTLTLDEKGAPLEGKANAGMYMTGGGNRKEAPTEMIFDKPFLVWTEHKGMRDSVFMAYITPDNWLEVKVQ